MLHRPSRENDHLHPSRCTKDIFLQRSKSNWRRRGFCSQAGDVASLLMWKWEILFLLWKQAPCQATPKRAGQPPASCTGTAATESTLRHPTASIFIIGRRVSVACLMADKVKQGACWSLWNFMHENWESVGEEGMFHFIHGSHDTVNGISRREVPHKPCCREAQEGRTVGIETYVYADWVHIPEGWKCHGGFSPSSAREGIPESVKTFSKLSWPLQALQVLSFVVWAPKRKGHPSFHSH